MLHSNVALNKMVNRVFIEKVRQQGFSIPTAPHLIWLFLEKSLIWQRRMNSAIVYIYITVHTQVKSIFITSKEQSSDKSKKEPK